MNEFFLVTRERGSAWNPKWPMNQQSHWRKHATFMNGLAESNFVRLGGPVDDAGSILLIVYAESEAEIRKRFAEDPWESMGVLETTDIRIWSVMLESPKGMIE